MPAKQASTAKAAPKKEEKPAAPKKAEAAAPKKAVTKPAAKAAPKKPAAPKAAGAKKPAAPGGKAAPKRPAPQGGKKEGAKKPKTGAAKPAAPKAAGAKKVAATKKPAAAAAAPTKGIKKGAKTAGISAKAQKVLSNKKQKVRPTKYIIDCTAPVDDGIMDPAAFEKFLHDRYKLSTGPVAKPGVLLDKVTIGRDKAKITITLHKGFQVSKFYLKYLTKKYLKSQQLRDWLRVISTKPDTYELRYYNIQENDEEEEDEEDDS